MLPSMGPDAGDSGAGSEANTSFAAGGTWPYIALLALVALGCLHALLYHLHAILVPFVLSGFVVLALQPSVEATYKLLAGLSSPYRWCCCGVRRRRSRELVGRQQPPSDGAAQRSESGGSDAGAADVEAAGEAEPLLEGAADSLATDLADGLCRFIAVTLVLLAMLLVALLIVALLCHQAMHMKENFAAYRAGVQRLEKLQDAMIGSVLQQLHMTAAFDHRIKEGYNAILNKAQEGVWTTVNTIASGLSEGLSSTVIMMLYVLFWLLQPLPTGGKAGALVRSYIYKKMLVSFLYGFCVAMLFAALGIDLAVLFGTVSFCLNFVPEVGAFISMLVPIPVILLDGRLANPFQVLIAAVVGQILLKFIFGNILEVKLIERDREMSIHPVWVILGLSYFGFVWGPIGMLISVPMLAMIKTAAMSARAGGQGGQAIAPALAASFLACFESRRVAQPEVLVGLLFERQTSST